MKKNIFILCALGMVSLCSHAGILPIPENIVSDQFFKKFDLNKDGEITKSEFHEYFEHLAEIVKAKRKSLFDQLDSNRDGMISEEEFINIPIYSEPIVDKGFEKLDTNNDEILDKSEIKEQAKDSIKILFDLMKNWNH